jgi:putative transposase
MKTNQSCYHGYRYPPDIISHAVWLYHRFALSFRDVEELLAERGVVVTYETIRQWCQKFGPHYARKLRYKQGRLGDIWHLDELFVNIQGKRHYLWVVTDKLRSYSAAHRQVMPSVVHDTRQYANNRAEVSHQPTRQRERQMRRFKSPGQAQRFLAVHGVVQNLFGPGRHHMRSENYRWLRDRSFREWREVTAA